VRRTSITVSLVAAALGGAQAPAQLATGRSGSSTMTYFSGDAVLAEALTFGECYAKAQPAKSLRLIATQPGSREEAQTYVAMFKSSNQGCLGDVVELRVPLDMVRGGIAEGLYKGRIPVPAELMQTVPVLKEIRNLSGAARCYVATHREEARRLIASTGPGSRKEFDAVMKLLPDFRKCVPSGAKAQFSPTLVRFRLAEALLRTPPAVSAGAK
jgi:hypothetical protein